LLLVVAEKKDIYWQIMSFSWGAKSKIQNAFGIAPLKIGQASCLTDEAGRLGYFRRKDRQGKKKTPLWQRGVRGDLKKDSGRAGMTIREDWPGCR
jgi:hypothetical protein